MGESGLHSTPTLPAVAGGEPVRPRQRFLTFGAPVLEQEEIAAVTRCLERRWVGTGPLVAEFERAFAAYKGAAHAVAVSSCTAAMHLAMLAAGVGPGDEVITSTMTYCSTAHAIIHTGATPVLVDCDPCSFNLLPQELESAISARTRAIIVVHMCGRCADMDAIMPIARRHGLFVIEDCAHAIEASCHGTPAGLIGDVGCFSFYATKNVTTVEGGMVVTARPDLADEVRILAHQGMTLGPWSRLSAEGYRHYDVVRAGFKYNMPDLHAAIGLVQLAKIEGRAQRRAACWRRYDAALADLPLLLPPPQEPSTRHARHLYTPLLQLESLTANRDAVLDALKAENIGTGVHFIPLHRLRYFAERYRWPPGRFPNADFVGDRTLSLPLTADMTEADIEDVCRALRRILAHYHR